MNLKKTSQKCHRIGKMFVVD